jgi:CO/xanthine dehydrogenase Mo-binding subunit/CO/xanthine dehydrogenase FAD-binding subunit
MRSFPPSPLGARILNVDWPDKTAGAARYAGDLRLPGMLHAAICRSPHAHARILSIDASPARHSPGVVATLTSSDLPDHKYIHHDGPLSDRHVLASSVVRYIGEEVAAVAAETIEQARAAAARFDIRYDRLRPATTIADARHRRAPRIHQHAEANVAMKIARTFGVDPGDEPGDVHICADYTFPAHAHACMETNTVVAAWAPATQRLELWVSTQAPHLVREEIAHVLDLNFDQVVVHQVAVGGGFGSKSKVAEYEAIAAALAMKTRRPVSLALARDEEFIATKTRHRFEINLTTSARADGTLTSRRAIVNVDNGAYNHSGPSVMGAAVGSLASLHRVPLVSVDARLVYTNKHPGGQFRGYGNPQATFAMESQLDELAEHIGVDPIELRIRNANQPGDVTLAGYRLGSVGVVECLEAAREAIGWSEKRSSGGSGHGVGIAAAIQITGAYAYPSANRSSAAVDVCPDGRIRVRFAGADAGTGQRTILAQVAAAEFGVATQDVAVVMMESALAPIDLGAWSSRGTYMGAHAVAAAARGAATQLRARAGGLAGLPVAQTRLGGGRVSAGGQSWTIPALMALTDPTCGPLSVTEEFVADMEEPNYRTGQADMAGAYSFAAHAVELDVDRRTGKVHVSQVVAAHDSGTILNPLLAESQVVGGVVMALGAALGEELLYHQGKLINPSYLHYPLPRAADAPAVRPVFVNTHDPKGPYGAKGLGEIANVPTAAAVANAVAHAVGVRIRHAPLTPDKILDALRARSGRARPRYHLWRRPARWEIAALRRAYPLGVAALAEHFGAATRPSTPVPIHTIDTPVDIDVAVQAMSDNGARPLCGGTDLLPAARQGLTNTGHLIDLMQIPALDQTHVSDDGTWRIGATVRLAALERHISDATPAGVIAAAVRTIASAQIREMATVAGNLCQQNRCWFYRNDFACYKRGGFTRPCYAIDGDHRFHHAVMGAHRCQAVTPSDLATVLTALDATIVTTTPGGGRLLPIARLYRGPGETVLHGDELLTEVRVPVEAHRRRSAFGKLNLTSGGFAIVSACASLRLERGVVRDARIVMGALAPTPVRLPSVERALMGWPRSRRSLVEIAELWKSGAHPLPRNGWKVDAAAGLLLTTLEQCLETTD